MLKITIPNNNIAERKYILDIIFDEFLGLDFKVLESDDCQDWEIERAKFDYVTTFSNINDAIEYAMHKKNFIHN